MKQLGIYPSLHHKLYDRFKLSDKTVIEDSFKIDVSYLSQALGQFISSIENDKRDYQVVNTINRNHITGVSNNAAIEITARITKDGPKPVHIGEAPNSNKRLSSKFESL